MRIARVFLMALAASALYAADGRFNGRWDLTPETPNRGWCFELKGAETDHPSGTFASAYNGDLNQMDEISIQPGELTFAFLIQERPREDRPAATRRLVYKARLAGDRLEGTFETEGRGRPPVKWVGVRAPVIPDQDDGTWKEGRPVRLLGSGGLTGWHAAGGGDASGWTVSDGVLATSGKGNNIVSDEKFWNFKLHMECKVSEHSNSGIGLRGRYEVQVLDDYGLPPNAHGNGALYSRIAPSENASKPAGEWQAYDIRLVGRWVTVTLNDRTIIAKREVEGLTAIAVDSREAEPGPIYLQGDHGSVEYRNIVVTPLIRNQP